MSVLLLAIAPICGAQQIDVQQDWNARKANALYAENFDYASKSALIAAAAQVNGNLTTNLSLDTEHTLSGKGVRIGVPASGGGNTGSWNNYINGQDDSKYQRFFLQFVFYADEHWLNYPYKQSGGDVTNPKIIIIDQWNSSYNPGEVVITNRATRGFVTAYRGTGSDYPPFNKQISGNDTPCPNGDPDYLWQFPLDRGTPDPVVTCADFKRRYGPLHYNFSGSISSGVLLDQQGNPDPDAAIGGVTWKKDGYTVVEVFIDHNADIVKIWASEYGKRPTLVVDTTVLSKGAELGGSGYNGFQLTPYRTNGASNEANRRDTYVSYTEVITSMNEVPFPGGYALPDGPEPGEDVVRPEPPTGLTVGQGE